MNTNTEMRVMGGNSTVRSELVTSYAERFRTFAKSAVVETLEMCNVLLEAKQTLASHEYEDLCVELRLDPKSSTERKYIMIARNSSRFKPYLDKLPQSWTTLYRLTNISADEFDRLLAQDKISSTSTAADIDKLLSKVVVSDAPSLTLVFDPNVNAEALAKVETAVKSLKTIATLKVNLNKLAAARLGRVNAAKQPAATIDALMVEAA